MTRLGFVGLGLIGARRAKIARSLGYPISFAVDPDHGRFTALELEDCAYYPSIEALDCAPQPQVDAIFVAVPHDLACSASIWALAKGCHVLCEKPMGLNLDEAERIQQAAKAAGREFCAGFNYRYLPGVTALRDLLEGDRIGEIYRVRMGIGHGGRPGMESEWKLKRARAGGGALIDPGIHLVDLALHLLGPQTLNNVVLSKKFWNSDVEDNCALTLVGGSGALVSIEVSLTSWKNQFFIEVYGSEGMATLSGRGGNYGTQRVEYTKRWFWQGAGGATTLELGNDDPSFELETRAFLDLIAAGKRDGVLSDAASGRAAIALVGSAYADAAPSF